MILFYDHLIDKSQLHDHIHLLHSNRQHQNKLKELVDEVIHHQIIHFLLKKLKPYHKQTFIDKLHFCPYDPDILIFLSQNIHPEIEQQITTHFQEITIKIKQDLG